MTVNPVCASVQMQTLDCGISKQLSSAVREMNETPGAAG